MTPSAITPAARGTSTKRSSRKQGRKASSKRGSGTSAAGPNSSARGGNREAPDAQNQRVAGHRSKVRRPRVPRRVSGPAAGSPADRAPASSAPARPARSRPARRSPHRGARPAARGSLLVRARVFVGALPDHPLLDRIIRGRAWIPILGVLLAGIVAMQVEVLKLSATTGRSIERSTALASRNELLRASVAELSDDQRIERLAAGMGMVMPAPEAVSFLHVGHADTIRQALRSIHAPDAAGFLAALPVIDTPAGAAAAAASSATTPGAAVTPVAPTPTATTATPAASATTTPGATPVGAALTGTGG